MPLRLAALTGLIAVMLWIWSGTVNLDAEMARKVRLAAQVQFMHGMVVFSCATFMNIGAKRARHAPPFLFAGMALYCLPIFAGAWSGYEPPSALLMGGIAAFAASWLILAWASREIDWSPDAH